MGRKRVRKQQDWTGIHIKKVTRKKLNIMSEQNNCKTIEELINKMIKKFKIR